MLLDNVIQSLSKLVKIHLQLIDLSEEKTELIKKGKVEDLQDKILDERKLVLLLEQYEGKRQEAVKDWFSSQKFKDENQTITSMLNKLENEEEQNKLASITTDLTEAITTLKRSEQLNRELLEQSMQFVNMSLHLLQPSLQNMNYGEQDSELDRGRSVFDSKA